MFESDGVICKLSKEASQKAPLCQRMTKAGIWQVNTKADVLHQDGAGVGFHCTNQIKGQIKTASYLAE